MSEAQISFQFPPVRAWSVVVIFYVALPLPGVEQPGSNALSHAQRRAAFCRSLGPSHNPSITLSRAII